jgi:hypothetical protein
MLRLASAVVAVGAVLALAGCDGSSQRSSQDGGAPGTVAELTSVDQLREAFRDDAGATRLVVLLSPT